MIKISNLKILDIFNITELSRITNKTRPTIYKYLKEYDNNNLNEIPYAFVTLFNMIKDNKAKEEINKFAMDTFNVTSDNAELNEILKMIKDNKDTINVSKLRKCVEGLIK